MQWLIQSQKYAPAATYIDDCHSTVPRDSISPLVMAGHYPIDKCGFYPYKPHFPPDLSADHHSFSQTLHQVSSMTALLPPEGCISVLRILVPLLTHHGA